MPVYPVLQRVWPKDEHFCFIAWVPNSETLLKLPSPWEGNQETGSPGPMRPQQRGREGAVAAGAGGWGSVLEA